MGRSVSYASGSIAIAYQYLDAGQDENGKDIEPDSDTFDYVIDDIKEYSKSLWPSFENADEWLGREDHAILENRHAYIGISEYCGLVSVWLVPKEDNNLSVNFCLQIKDKFLKSFGTLNKVGQFSNGEAVFERVKA